jgi:hypothetical protein
MCYRLEKVVFSRTKLISILEIFVTVAPLTVVKIFWDFIKKVGLETISHRKIDVR